MLKPVIAFLLLLSVGQAQIKTYSVHGTVQDAVTGRPVKNALVLVERIGRSSSSNVFVSTDQPDGHTESRAVLSGTMGEFQFDALSEGEYEYSVQKPGYDHLGESENAGNFVVPLAIPARGIEIKLIPLGCIEGRHVDQYDEPVENVVVDVYKLGIQDGEKSTYNVASVWTDYRGLFKVSDLESGKYYVKAQVKRGGTELHPSLIGIRPSMWESFSPVYFGGATHISSAVPVVVQPGTRARADFRLDMNPGFRIRGKIADSSESDSVVFELLQRDHRSEPIATVLDFDGNFEIFGVLPGEYTLRVTQGNTRGEAAINVGPQDVTGVSIALSPPATIHGFTRYVAGTSTPPNSPIPCEVLLYEHWSLETIHMAAPDPAGGFSIKDVFPGTYDVRVHCYGGYPQSIFFGGRDLLTTPALTISAGAAPPSIQIDYKPGGGNLKVIFAKPAPQNAGVLLIPQFSPSTGPLLPDMPPPAPVGSQPGYDILVQNLAPGDYIVYGLSNCEEAEFRNPAFVAGLPTGSRVHIDDGQTVEITIGISSK